MLSEDTALNFLHRIKEIVYIAGTKCGYCAVRIEYVYMFRVRSLQSLEL